MQVDRLLACPPGRVPVDDAPRSKRRRSRGAGCVVTVELREIREADVPTLFAHQADPEANAMAAFPARDEPAFREHLARVFANPASIIRAVVSGEVLVGEIRELGRRGRAQGRLLDRPRALGQRVRNGGATSIDHDRHSTSVVGAHRGSQRRLAAGRRAVRLRARPLRAGRRPGADLRATGLSQSQTSSAQLQRSRVVTTRNVQSCPTTASAICCCGSRQQLGTSSAWS